MDRIKEDHQNALLFFCFYNISFLTLTRDVRVIIYNKNAAEKGGNQWMVKLLSKVMLRD